MSAVPVPAAQWLTEPGLQHLFTEFPLPLAIVGIDTGEVHPNPRFAALLDSRRAVEPPLRELVAAPGLAWQRVHLSGRAGLELDLRARALHTPFGAMLVLDEGNAGEPVALRQIGALQARVAELERLSATDRLTGAWNRAHFDRAVDGELARSRRLRQPLALLLIDVDHFKRVNDTHGHAAGDGVLKELVTLVGRNVRASDLVFRWGGEEFAVLAIGAGVRAGERLGEKLRAAVAAHDFPGVGRLTVSLGVAELLPEEAAASWFARVDAQLYAVKNAGRNAVGVDRAGATPEADLAATRGALHLAWRADYESGEPEMDEQHRVLFDLGNALIDATSGVDPDPHAIAAAFDRLLDHVSEHFRDEERLLARLGYPRLDAHARAHLGLLQRAVRLRADAEAGKVSFGAVVDFLANDVVARHLFAMDQDWFAWVAKATG